MTVNDALLDTANRHQVFLIRFGGSTAKRVVEVLDEAQVDLARRIRAKIAALSPDARDAALQPGVRRLQNILRDIRGQRRDVRRAMMSTTRGDLIELARVEVDIADRRLTEAVGVDLGNFRPSPEVLRSLVTDEVMRGRRIGEWFTKLSTEHRVRLENAVRLGLIEGRTTPQIIRDLRAATEITKRSAATLVRTSVNHVANRARETLYAANTDVIRGLRWTATLDGRTSDICVVRDGKVAPLGTATVARLKRGSALSPPGARPPAHPNCRSVMTPITRSWDELAKPGALKSGRGATDIDTLISKSAPKFSPARGTMQAFVRRSMRIEKLSAAETAGVREYQAINLFETEVGGFPTLQKFLRTGSTTNLGKTWPKAKVRKLIDGAVKAAEKGVLTEDVAVLRVVDDVKKIFGTDDLTSLVGKTIEEKGFVSTTIDKNVLGRFVTGPTAPKPSVVLKMELPKGTRAFPTDLIVDMGERELMLPPGLRFKIIKLDRITVEGQSFDRLTLRLQPRAREPVDFSGLFADRLRTKGFSDSEIVRIKRSTRASMDGQVPSKVTYAEWLKRQPAGFQDDVLGRTRGRLFREGGLKVDRFVDARSGRSFTLDQLRRKETAAFSRAGIKETVVQD